ncbi:MAG: FHA domain-containing protein, partial [Planctomycetota bacterium]
AVDVPLPADIHSHHADIIRRGDDYFLTAYGPVEVNHQRLTQSLLRDGDRLALGAGRLLFARPSAKSASAVLRLSHRCRLPQDVSDIVLFRETCLVGPAASCHLRTHGGEDQIVLFERGGALYARQTAGRGWLSAPARAVVAGQPLEFGDLRVTVRPGDLSA